jgi:hypothetical protein
MQVLSERTLIQEDQNLVIKQAAAQAAAAANAAGHTPLAAGGTAGGATSSGQVRLASKAETCTASPSY